MAFRPAEGDVSVSGGPATLGRGTDKGGITSIGIAGVGIRTKCRAIPAVITERMVTMTAALDRQIVRLAEQILLLLAHICCICAELRKS